MTKKGIYVFNSIMGKTYFFLLPENLISLIFYIFLFIIIFYLFLFAGPGKYEIL